MRALETLELRLLTGSFLSPIGDLSALWSAGGADISVCPKAPAAGVPAKPRESFPGPGPFRADRNVCPTKPEMSAPPTPFQATPFRLDPIDPGHTPQLWWNAERLQQARDWLTTHSVMGDDPWSNAFRYAVAGDVNSGANAINSLLGFTISQQELDGVASDSYRWSDWVPAVYDWCHELMTPDQRAWFVQRYNGYTETLMNHAWGNIGMEGTNYFQGYLRNELSWLRATAGENPDSAVIQQNADARWNSLVDYMANAGRGGVPVDGSEYGLAQLAYPVVPLQSATLHGRDMWDETNWFKEAITNLIYTTSPAPTYRKYDPNPYYQIFPFRDDEHDGGYPAASYLNYNGDFMSTVANHYAGVPIGQYARQWLDMVQPSMSTYVAALDQAGAGAALDFSNLPLDYYAPGTAGFLYSRNQWGRMPPTSSCTWARSPTSP